MNKKSLLCVTLAAMLALGTAQAQNPRVAVVTTNVQTHEVSQSLTLVGKLEARQSVIISPEVTGKVSIIAVEANQQVKKGQFLLQLNDDKAKAALAEAQAYLKDEKRKLTEFERLIKRSAITQSEIDAQKTSVDIAQARLNAAEANLRDLHIRAPFDGTVGFIDFSRGKLVNAGSDLFSLDNLSQMRLDLPVPEHYLPEISTGMPVSGTTSAWPGKQFEGKLTAIDSRINSETLNLRVRIQFANPDGLLKPGMLISANLVFPPVKAPVIPVQALEYSGTKRYVYVIGDDDVAQRREVFLGARIENDVVIEKGLKIGEKIVVQGVVNMRNGVGIREVDPQGYPLQKDKQ